MADGLENSRHPPFRSGLDVKIASLSPPFLRVMDGWTSRADVSLLLWHLSYHTTCAAANGVLPYGKVHSGITSRPERRSHCLSLYLAVIAVSLGWDKGRDGFLQQTCRWSHLDEIAVMYVREGTQAAGSVGLEMQVIGLWHCTVNGIFVPLKVTAGSTRYS